MDSFGAGTSRRGLVEEWGGVRWAAALPGAAGASVCALKVKLSPPVGQTGSSCAGEPHCAK